MKLLYICSSQFSGSTLTSFLLNCHSRIATIGHTTGWPQAGADDFRCSCGDRLADCRLFTRIEQEYAESGLRFDPVDFGTDLRLSGMPRLNQILTGPIPWLRYSPVERLRDRVVGLLPGLRSTLDRQLLANRVLMGAVLDFHGASVYLDNSHSPYRYRRLSQSDSFDVMPIHLIRDPRGVCLSLMTNSGYEASQAVTAWIGHQTNIHRITYDHADPFMLKYESLCADTANELAAIHEYAGLPAEPLVSNFKDSEHHILGNRMRLQPGEIRLDERWRRDLETADRHTIEAGLASFCRDRPDHALTAIIQDYFEESAPN